MTGIRHAMVRLAAMTIALACIAVSSIEANADARTCRRLEAELASSSGGSAKSRKYEKAIEAQREQLSKARRQARGAGCGFSFFGAGKERCGSLNATIDRMERNLASLQRTHGAMAGSGGSKRERARILAAIDANGCRDTRTASTERDPVRRNSGDLFQQLFGGGVQRRDTLEDFEGERIGRTLNPGGGILEILPRSGGRGSYRTLCVRTCDGYYFPISSASSTGDFDRDQKNCESMCPGTQVELYSHDANNEESDAMVSTASGRPYSEMPTAYLYRQAGAQRPESCSCNASKSFSIIAGNPTGDAVPAEPVIPLPAGRPDPAANPETLANVEGALDSEAILRMLQPKAGSTLAADVPSRVRVVGPVFLPDPAAAIDLRAPAQKKVQ